MRRCAPVRVAAGGAGDAAAKIRAVRGAVSMIGARRRPASRAAAGVEHGERRLIARAHDSAERRSLGCALAPSRRRAAHISG
ncbi:hypothetical protein WS83_05190 [Burkholderia sp. MSMB2042]|nr:hypothetical protein WS78_11340 [Burkholderia savannae]KVG47179.1 hypothetical protein WS77_28865 [Burkholderia sp. MSMB0265]KVG77951.1 hypothetical protein WS81_17435 [Burkholderia sp. MSMB2040]KVG95251.1 hypothetical protein WS83_05190 [Burkholderia sp. MSMB2042]KVG99414.1 hypothetical protein WS82_24695 [Burkholderia sp. MSMB2041]